MALCKLHFMKEMLCWVCLNVRESLGVGFINPGEAVKLCCTSGWQCLKRWSDRFVNTLMMFPPVCSLAYARPTFVLLT